MQIIKIDVVNDKFEFSYNDLLAYYNKREELLWIDSYTDNQMYMTPFDYNSKMYLNPHLEDLDKRTLTFDFIPNCNYADQKDIILLKRFHYTWYNELKDYLKTDEFFQLLQTIESLRRTKELFPKRELMFNAFLMDLRKVKGVWIGESPYPTHEHAIGTAFATWNHQVPKSLEILKKGIAKDLGLQNYALPNDLGVLTHKGILLLNYTLVIDKEKSTIELFRSFINEIIKVLNKKEELSVILFGAYAQKLHSLFITPNIYSTSHPISASYSNTEWDTKNVFLNFSNHIKL